MKSLLPHANAHVFHVQLHIHRKPPLAWKHKSQVPAGEHWVYSCVWPAGAQFCLFRAPWTGPSHPRENQAPAPNSFMRLQVKNQSSHFSLKAIVLQLLKLSCEKQGWGFFFISQLAYNLFDLQISLQNDTDRISYFFLWHLARLRRLLPQQVRELLIHGCGTVWDNCNFSSWHSGQGTK